MRDADHERVLPRHVVDAHHARRGLARVPVFDREDHEGADDERRGHARRIEEVFLDEVLRGEADDGRRQERDEEVRGEALLHAVAREPRECLADTHAELPAHGKDRTQLDHDVEDLALLVVQPEEVRDDDEVPGRGDR